MMTNRLTDTARASALLLLLLAAVLLQSCAAIDYRLDIAETTMPQGSVAYFRLSGARGIESTPAVFTGGNVRLAQSAGEEAVGIIATDIETPPGVHMLTIGEGRHKKTTVIEVTKADYGTQRITVNKAMVDLDPETLERVGREAAEISLLWLDSSPAPLWDGPFAMPVKGPVTSTFGTRRVLNGSPRGYHGGIDIAAREGTPVRAANSGRVVFTGEFYFYGRFVVIDHGAGVFTLYSHLSEVLVGRDEAIGRDTVIGRVGMTGRATGPHLHFAVKVGTSRVSPARLYAVVDEIEGLMRAKSAAGVPEG